MLSVKKNAVLRCTLIGVPTFRSVVPGTYDMSRYLYQRMSCIPGRYRVCLRRYSYLPLIPLLLLLFHGLSSSSGTVLQTEEVGSAALPEAGLWLHRGALFIKTHLKH